MSISNPARLKAFNRGVGIVALAVSVHAGTAFADEAQSSAPEESFLSRITVNVPFFTRHIPKNRGYNNDNWGGWLDVALDKQWSVVAGGYTNSYYRDTFFAGISYLPVNLEFSKIKIDAGGMIGLDLNGGYKGFNSVDPLLGALSLKIGGVNYSDPDYDFLNRLGMAITVIPPAGSHGTSAVNLALTYRL